MERFEITLVELMKGVELVIGQRINVSQQFCARWGCDFLPCLVGQRGEEHVGVKKFLAGVRPRFGNKRAVPQRLFVVSQMDEGLVYQFWKKDHAEPELVRCDKSKLVELCETALSADSALSPREARTWAAVDVKMKEKKSWLGPGLLGGCMRVMEHGSLCISPFTNVR